MFLEDSGSSLDGEIAPDGNYFGDSFSSFDPASPSKTAFKEELNAHNDHFDSHFEGFAEEMSRPVVSLSTNQYQNACELYIPSCLKINSLLATKGLNPMQFSENDINSDNKTMSVFVVDSWAQSVLNELDVIFDRLDHTANTVLESSFSNKLNDSSREAIDAHIRDLQKKLAQAENKLNSKSNENSSLG